MTTHKIWHLQPPECDGTYTFSGRCAYTFGIHTELSPPEITGIVQDVRAFVRENNGTDYLLVFENAAGEKIFCVDSLDAALKESGEYEPEDDHWTIMWAHEY